MERQANTMHHEPGRFLSDPQAPADLVGGHAILRIDHHPHGTEPFIHLDGAILEDGPHLDSVLLLASLADPHGSSLHEAMVE